MKVAVISDIHGNMQALDTVLEDIEREKCDRIFCLGDLAMAGPEPVEAILKIKELFDDNKLELIQGNTDEMIACYDEMDFSDIRGAFPIMGAALDGDVTLIPENLKQFLKGLFAQKELVIEGVKVLLVHGSPRKNSENILPDLPLKVVEEMISATDADIIFCGHTHIPCGYQMTKKQTIVNVGSVGRSFTQNPQACYAIVEFDNKSYNVEHKLLNYNNKLASEILAKRQFEGAKKLAEILIKPEKRHM